MKNKKIHETTKSKTGLKLVKAVLTTTALAAVSANVISSSMVNVNSSPYVFSSKNIETKPLAIDGNNIEINNSTEMSVAKEVKQNKIFKNTYLYGANDFVNATDVNDNVSFTFSWTYDGQKDGGPQNVIDYITAINNNTNPLPTKPTSDQMEKITELHLPDATSLPRYAFQESVLSKLSLGKVNKILDGTFLKSKLVELYAPSLTSIGTDNFKEDSALNIIDLPKLKELADGVFMGATQIREIHLPKLTNLEGRSFGNLDVSKLESLDIGTGDMNTPTTILYDDALPKGVKFSKHDGTVYIGGTTETIPKEGIVYGAAWIYDGSLFGRDSSDQSGALKMKTYLLAVNSNRLINQPVPSSSEFGKLTKLSIPFARSINDRQFEDAPLTYLDLSNGETIGQDAFKGADLDILHLRNAKEIKTGAFSKIDKDKIKSIIIGSNGVETTVKSGAFDATVEFSDEGGYKVIDEVNIGVIVHGPSWTYDGDFMGFPSDTYKTKIMQDFFNAVNGDVKDLPTKPGCDELSKYSKLRLPDATTIPSRAFDEIVIKELVLPKVKVIESYAFELAKLVRLEAPELIEIKAGNFQHSPELRIIDLPKLEVLGKDVFKGSKKLQEIHLPQLQKLMGGSFANLEKGALESLDIGTGNKNIETTVESADTFPSWLELMKEDGNIYKGGTTNSIPKEGVTFGAFWIYDGKLYGIGADDATGSQIMNDYLLAVNSGSLSGVTVPTPSQFALLTKLTLPSVKTITNNQFEYAPIDFLRLATVETIGENAFKLATLETLYLRSVTEIKTGAFQSITDSKAKSMLIGSEGVKTHIQNGAFDSSIKFFDKDGKEFASEYTNGLVVYGPTWVYDSRFMGLPVDDDHAKIAIDYIVAINSNDTNIPTRPGAMPGLTGIKLPDAITIPDNAFAGARLSSIIAPKVISIGEYAFSGLKLPFKKIQIGTGNLNEVTTYKATSFPAWFHLKDSNGDVINDYIIPKEGIQDYAVIHIDDGNNNDDLTKIDDKGISPWYWLLTLLILPIIIIPVILIKKKNNKPTGETNPWY